jgi:hypothetical protein
LAQPFGDPDGSRGPIGEHEANFITLPREFGGIARPVNEATRARVIAGSQGAGKTLYLRRLQHHLKEDDSLYVDSPGLTARDLTTEIVVRISQLYPKIANPDTWKTVWDRSILVSATTHLLSDAEHHGSSDSETLQSLRVGLASILPEARGKRSIIEAAAQICHSSRTRRQFDGFLHRDLWSDLRTDFHDVARNSRPIYLFVDAIDDNFRFAPAYWLVCQKGLFDAVMDTQRTDVEDSKLHVVISIRDLVLSSIRKGEHANRYMNQDYIVSLDWGWKSAREFLHQKLIRLSPQYFTDPGDRSLESMFGRSVIQNVARKIEEPIDQYVLRHTRQNARDVIIMGNALTNLSSRSNGTTVDDSRFRRTISEISATQARDALAQVANQVLTNVMPWNASHYNFTEPYLTAEEYRVEVLTRELVSVLSHAESEYVSRDQLNDLDAEAEHRFGVEAEFSNALWQNRLIGYKFGPHYRFYSGGQDSETMIEHNADSYVLNPILLDLVPAISSREGHVEFPGANHDD